MIVSSYSGEYVLVMSERFTSDDGMVEWALKWSPAESTYQKTTHYIIPTTTDTLVSVVLEECFPQRRTRCSWLRPLSRHYILAVLPSLRGETWVGESPPPHTTLCYGSPCTTTTHEQCYNSGMVWDPTGTTTGVDLSSHTEFTS